MTLRSFVNFQLTLSRHRKDRCPGPPKRGALGHCLFGLCVNPSLQIKIYKVPRGLLYDADAAMAVPEPYYRNSFYILFPAKGIVSNRQIISGYPYVLLK